MLNDQALTLCACIYDQMQVIVCIGLVGRGQRGQLLLVHITAGLICQLDKMVQVEQVLIILAGILHVYSR